MGEVVVKRCESVSVRRGCCFLIYTVCVVLE